MDLGNLGHSRQITNEWIDDLDGHLGWNDKPRSYRLLKAVLCALGEQWPADGIADLAAHFPARLCGTNYEQWQTSTMPLKTFGAEDFVGRVGLWFRPDPIREPAAAILAVFDVLSEKVSEDEIEDMSRMLPEALRRTWMIDHTSCGRSV